MKGYVYILRDLKGKFYIGSTTNIGRRLVQHNKGHTQTTRNMNLPVVVLVQEYSDIDKARKIERKIKKLKRKDYVTKIVNNGEIRLN